MEKVNAINCYVCKRCDKPTRTVNRDEGVTPFAIECRATPGCGGPATSLMYRCSPTERPGWEWIRPTAEEFEEWLTAHRMERFRGELEQHVSRGGMLLRKLDAGRLEYYGFNVRLA